MTASSSSAARWFIDSDKHSSVSIKSREREQKSNLLIAQPRIDLADLDLDEFIPPRTEPQAAPVARRGCNELLPSIAQEMPQLAIDEREEKI